MSELLWRWLRLDGLNKLSEKLANSLSKTNVPQPKWTDQIKDDAAKGLMGHEGALILNGLVELSDKAASSFSCLECDLSLNGWEISDKTAIFV